MNKRVTLDQNVMTGNFVVTFDKEPKEFDSFKEADAYVYSLVRLHGLSLNEVRNIMSEG